MKKLFSHVKASKNKPISKDLSPEDAVPTPIHATHARYLTKPPPQAKQRLHEPDHPPSPTHTPRSASVNGDPAWEDHPQKPLLSGMSPSRSSSFNSVQPLSSPRPPSPRQGDRPPKKAPASAPVALGILKALDPHNTALPINHQQQISSTRSQSEERFAPPTIDRYSGSENGHPVAEKKEKRGFWSKDKPPHEHDRDRSVKDPAPLDRPPHARPREHKSHPESDKTVTSMIGYLAATASEDWSVVLEVCDRASASEAQAKEAVRALRSEFKYGQPAAQLAAAKLWAIMLRNASDVFITQSRSRKFLDTLEQILKSPQTNPVVAERLLEIVAAAAFASGRHRKGSERDGFRGLWLRVKPADKPDEGIPFDSEDAMFSPPSRASGHDIPIVAYQQASPLPIETPIPSPNVKPHRLRHKSPSRNRIIPPEEDIRRLFQECKMGQGNASLLSEALISCTPAELKKSDIINEFYLKCRSSQELIFAQIDWATAGAERSRMAKNQEQEREHLPSNESKRNKKRDEETIEEKLLAALLAANEDLLGAIRQYEDLARIADEKRVEARSRQETRIDRRELAYQQQQAEFVGGSNSRSPSPSSRSHSPSPGVNPSYQRPHHENEAGLAPPPKVSYGPRSPGPISLRSRTPSPNSQHLDEAVTTNGYASSYDQLHQYQDDNISSTYYTRDHYQPDTARGEESDPDDEPVGPSEKALGKRKATEVVPISRVSIHSDDLYLDQDNGLNDERFDSDNESNDGRWRHPPTQYIYDAAAERTQQRLEEATRLVNGIY